MRFVIALLSWLLIGPAFASISAPISIGSGGPVNSGSNSPALTTAAPAGTLVIIILDANNNNDTFTNVKDSQGNCGNAYSIIQASPQSATATHALAYCIITTALTTSDAINTTTSDAGQWYGTFYNILGASGGIDANQSVTSSSTGTSLSLVSGTLAAPEEILIGSFALSFTDVVTESSGFTNLYGAGAGSSAAAGYAIVHSTATVTYHPTWSPTGRLYSGVLASFKISPRFGLSLVGVGTK